MKALKNVAVALATGSLVLTAAAASAQMINSPGASVWTPSGDVTVKANSAETAKAMLTRPMERS